MGVDVDVDVFVGVLSSPGESIVSLVRLMNECMGVQGCMNGGICVVQRVSRLDACGWTPTKYVSMYCCVFSMFV